MGTETEMLSITPLCIDVSEIEALKCFTDVQFSGSFTLGGQEETFCISEHSEPTSGNLSFKGILCRIIIEIAVHAINHTRIVTLWKESKLVFEYEDNPITYVHGEGTHTTFFQKK